ncbi:MAG: MATE family efflux transporter, partial [candidate division Zixibacteria bacterium]
MNIPLHDDLNSKQMRRVIYSLALPIVGTHLLLRGVGIVDTAMVGHISAQAQAAVGMSQWIVNMLMALMQAINVGGTVLVARYTGAGDEENRKSAADTAFWAGLISAIIMALIGIIAVRPIAGAMGADSVLTERVYSYMMILCFFFVSRATIIIVSGIFQGYGDTKTPFRVIVGVNAVHLLIALPLTFGLYGFPRLEIEGVALATGISETLGALL